MESLWDWSERATTLESGKSCIRPSETPLLRKRPEESRIGWPGWYRIVLCSQLPILTWYLWDYRLEFGTSKCGFATQEGTAFASFLFAADSILCVNHIIFRMIGGSHRCPPCFLPYVSLTHFKQSWSKLTLKVFSRCNLYKYVGENWCRKASRGSLADDPSWR